MARSIGEARRAVRQRRERAAPPVVHIGTENISAAISGLTCLMEAVRGDLARLEKVLQGIEAVQHRALEVQDCHARAVAQLAQRPVRVETVDTHVTLPPREPPPMRFEVERDEDGLISGVRAQLTDDGC